MDDELYVAFGAKVTTTSNNNPTIAPPIAWRGLRYLSAKTVPWPPVRVDNVRFGSKADMCIALGDVCFVPIGDIALTRTRAAVMPKPVDNQVK